MIVLGGLPEETRKLEILEVRKTIGTDNGNERH
jgi:hypothetical protein